MNKKDNSQMKKNKDNEKMMYGNKFEKKNLIIPPPNERFCCICGKKCDNLSKISRKEKTDSNAVFGRIFHILNVEWPSVRDRYFNKKVTKPTMPIIEIAKEA